MLPLRSVGLSELSPIRATPHMPDVGSCRLHFGEWHMDVVVGPVPTAMLSAFREVATILSLPAPSLGAVAAAVVRCYDGVRLDALAAYCRALIHAGPTPASRNFSAGLDCLQVNHRSHVIMSNMAVITKMQQRLICCLAGMTRIWAGYWVRQ